MSSLEDRMIDLFDRMGYWTAVIAIFTAILFPFLDVFYSSNDATAEKIILFVLGLISINIISLLKKIGNYKI